MIIGKESHDFTFKILTIGESGVGKTCILLRYTDNTFSRHHMTTIGIDFKTKVITYYGKSIRIIVWDTAGQERFRNITNQYYNGADGVFLIYDVTKRESFAKITDWMKQILSYSKKDKIGLILLGNKVDMMVGREVSQEEGEKLAADYGITYLETSAMNNYNIQEAFYAMIKEIFVKKGIELKENYSGGRFSIHSNPGTKTEDKCIC